MTLVRLGLRLALAGGTFRAGAIALAYAVGTVVVLLAQTAPGPLTPAGRRLTSDQELLVQLLVVFALLPVGMLLLSVSRLSASTRDRRLAALRTLGVSPGSTRVVAAVEGVVLAAAGIVVGTAVYAAGAPTAVAWAERALGRPGTSGVLPPAGVAQCVVVLVVVALVVSLAPTRQLSRRALHVRRGASVRPSVWRVVPLAAAVGALLFVLSLPSVASLRRMPDADEPYTTLTFAAILMAGFGILWAVPVVVRLVGAFLGRHATAHSLRLAGRRLELEPSAALRTSAAMTAAVFVAATATGFIAMMQADPTYRAEAAAMEDGPQFHGVIVDALGEGPESSITPAEAAAVYTEVAAASGVTGMFWRTDGCTFDDGSECGTVIVGSCAELAALQHTPGCADNGRAWLVQSEAAGPAPGGKERVNLVLPGGTFSIPLSEQVLGELDERPHEGMGESMAPALLIPAATPGLVESLGPTLAFAVSGSGYDVRAAVGEAIREAGALAMLQDVGLYEDYNRWILVIWCAVAAVVGLGLLNIALAGLDRAIERRREVARLQVVGVPRPVLMAGQALQVMVPLLIAVTLAIPSGGLAAAALARFAYTTPDAQTSMLGWLTGAALLASFTASLLTVAGTASRLTPSLLRTE